VGGALKAYTYVGEGAPAGGLGAVGDTFFDEANELEYGPKTVGGWGAGSGLFLDPRAGQPDGIPLAVRQPRNVMDFGADNTNANPAATTAAFVAAHVQAILLGQEIYAPAGRYKVDARFESSVPIRGDGPGRTIIDRSGNFEHVRFAGSKAASISLSANVSAGAIALPFANDAAVASISPGDRILLRSTTVFNADSGKTGERARVVAKTAPFTADTTNASATLTNLSDPTAVVQGAAVSGTGIPGGTTITSVDRGNKTATMSANATATNVAIAIATSNTLLGLGGQIDEPYTTAASATIEKITDVVGPLLRDLTLAGTNGATTRGGAMFTYCRGVLADNVEFRNLDGPGVQPDTCDDWTVSNCTFTDLTDDNAAGRVGYGVNIRAACANGLVVGCKFRNVRHAVTTTGGDDGVPHNILVAFCQSQGAGSIFDTHNDGRGIVFLGCEVHNGADAFRSRCPDVLIIDPIVRNCTGLGVQSFGPRTKVLGGEISVWNNQCIRFLTGGDDGVVKGTSMVNTNGVGGGGGGIRVDTGVNRCLVEQVDGKNLSEVVVLNGGSGHHVRGVFGDNANNVVRVAAGASAVVRDVDSVNSTTDVNNAGTILNRGRDTLVAGTKTINTALARTNSRIVIQLEALGTVATPKALGVTARVNGTSFTVTSADATDTSTFSWEILHA
jgi:hypothetical protein